MCPNNIPLLSRYDILESIRNGLDDDIWNKIPINLKRDKEILAEIRMSIPLTICAIGSERNPMSPLRILVYDEHNNIVSDFHKRRVVSHIKKQLHKYTCAVQFLDQILPYIDEKRPWSSRQNDVLSSKRGRLYIVRMIDQGKETNGSLRQLIEEFAGIPSGDEFQCLQRARQNLMIYGLLDESK